MLARLLEHVLIFVSIFGNGCRLRLGQLLLLHFK